MIMKRLLPLVAAGLVLLQSATAVSQREDLSSVEDEMQLADSFDDMNLMDEDGYSQDSSSDSSSLSAYSQLEDSDEDEDDEDMASVLSEMSDNMENAVYDPETEELRSVRKKIKKSHKSRSSKKSEKSLSSKKSKKSRSSKKSKKSKTSKKSKKSKKSTKSRKSRSSFERPPGVSKSCSEADIKANIIYCRPKGTPKKKSKPRIPFYKKLLAGIKKSAAVVTAAGFKSVTSNIATIAKMTMTFGKVGVTTVKSCGGMLLGKTSIGACGKNLVNLAIAGCDVYASARSMDPYGGATGKAVCTGARALVTAVGACSKAASGGGGAKKCNRQVLTQMEDKVCVLLAMKTKPGKPTCERAMAAISSVRATGHKMQRAYMICATKSPNECLKALGSASSSACVALESDTALQDEMMLSSFDEEALEFTASDEDDLDEDEDELANFSAILDEPEPEVQQFDWEAHEHFFKDGDEAAVEDLRSRRSRKTKAVVSTIKKLQNACALMSSVKAGYDSCRMNFGATDAEVEAAQAEFLELSEAPEGRRLGVMSTLLGNMIMCGKAAASALVAPCKDTPTVMTALATGTVSATTVLCELANGQAATSKGGKELTEAGQACADDVDSAGCCVKAKKAAVTACTGWAIEANSDFRDSRTYGKASHACRVAESLYAACNGRGLNGLSKAIAVEQAALQACDVWYGETKADMNLYEVFKKTDLAVTQGCYIDPIMRGRKKEARIAAMEGASWACHLASVGKDNMKTCMLAAKQSLAMTCSGDATSLGCQKAKFVVKKLQTCSEGPTKDFTGGSCEAAVVNAVASFRELKKKFEEGHFDEEGSANNNA